MSFFLSYTFAIVNLWIRPGHIYHIKYKATYQSLQCTQYAYLRGVLGLSKISIAKIINKPHLFSTFLFIYAGIKSFVFQEHLIEGRFDGYTLKCSLELCLSSQSA